MNNATEPQETRSDWEWDPVFLHARREAWWILGFWLAALVWCVPYCYWAGYERPGHSVSLSMVMGIPAWLFWGVALPWGLAIVGTAFFCFRVMKNDSLEVDPARVVLPDADLSRQGGDE